MRDSELRIRARDPSFHDDLATEAHARRADIPIVTLISKNLTGVERELLTGKINAVMAKGPSMREELVSAIRTVGREPESNPGAADQH